VQSVCAVPESVRNIQAELLLFFFLALEPAAAAAGLEVGHRPVVAAQLAAAPTGDTLGAGAELLGVGLEAGLLADAVLATAELVAYLVDALRDPAVRAIEAGGESTAGSLDPGVAGGGGAAADRTERERAQEEGETADLAQTIQRTISRCGRGMISVCSSMPGPCSRVSMAAAMEASTSSRPPVKV